MALRLTWKWVGRIPNMISKLELLNVISCDMNTRSLRVSSIFILMLILAFLVNWRKRRLTESYLYGHRVIANNLHSCCKNSEWLICLETFWKISSFKRLIFPHFIGYPMAIPGLTVTACFPTAHPDE